MNDRYLFRGKRADNGEWETGFLVVERSDTSEERFYITDKMTGYHTPIIPETVGQCTGLKDKNGKLIFEGDIVRCKSRLDNANMVVIFECGQFRMVLSENYSSYKTNIGFYDINCFNKEIIGNIHDNPELLEVEE